MFSEDFCQESLVHLVNVFPPAAYLCCTERGNSKEVQRLSSQTAKHKHAPPSCARQAQFGPCGSAGQRHLSQVLPRRLRVGADELFSAPPWLEIGVLTHRLEDGLYLTPASHSQ